MEENHLFQGKTNQSNTQGDRREQNEEGFFSAVLKAFFTC